MKTLAFIFLLLLDVSGCDCKVTCVMGVNNRHKHPVEVIVDNSKLGVVPENNVATFEVEGIPDNGGSSYNNDRIMVRVVFRDITTGKTTRTRNVELIENQVIYTDVEDHHFLP
jgi:hypothetical protein